jgi:hypothetical protein
MAMGLEKAKVKATDSVKGMATDSGRGMAKAKETVTAKGSAREKGMVMACTDFRGRWARASLVGPWKTRCMR